MSNLETKTTNRKPRENPSGYLGTHDRNRYECKTCRKRFPTHQALGGHKGIHKKIHKLGDKNDKHWLTLNILAPKYSELHRCKLCKKGFGTGQALGGHMTRHRLEKLMVLTEKSGPKLASQGKFINLEVQPLRMMNDDDYKRCNMKRDQLVLAAREWRLSII